MNQFSFGSGPWLLRCNFVSEKDKVVSSEFFDSAFRSQAEYLVCELLDIFSRHILGSCPKSGRVQINAFLGLGRHYLTSHE